MKSLFVVFVLLFLNACGSVPKKSISESSLSQSEEFERHFMNDAQAGLAVQDERASSPEEPASYGGDSGFDGGPDEIQRKDSLFLMKSKRMDPVLFHEATKNGQLF